MGGRSLSRLLVYLGGAVVVGALGKMHAAQNGYDFTSSSRFAWAAAYVAILALTAYGNGIPDVVRSVRAGAARAVGALVMASLAVSVVQLAYGDALLPRVVVFGSGLVLLPWYLACVALATRGRRAASDRARVYVVGNLDEVAQLRFELDRDAERPATVIGSMTPEEAQPTADRPEPLRSEVGAKRATVVVLSRLAADDDAVVHQAARLHEQGLRMRSLQQFYEEWMGKLPLGELERASLFFDISEIHRAIYGRASRLLDLGIAIAAAVPLLVLIPFVAIANLAANRGPLFYTQPRVGKSGRQFAIYKFRTMRPASTGMVNEWTAESDPRITPFGRVLRRTHLDELPQVLNILLGHLSVVGPRPEQPHYVAELVEKLPFYELRHLVRPGLTGWAQVKYGYAGSESDALQKLQYEFFYLRHQGLRFDAKIMLRTVRSVLGREGR